MSVFQGFPRLERLVLTDEPYVRPGTMSWGSRVGMSHPSFKDRDWVAGEFFAHLPGLVLLALVCTRDQDVKAWWGRPGGGQEVVSYSGEDFHWGSGAVGSHADDFWVRMFKALADGMPEFPGSM